MILSYRSQFSSAVQLITATAKTMSASATGWSKTTCTFQAIGTQKLPHPPQRHCDPCHQPALRRMWDFLGSAGFWFHRSSSVSTARRISTTVFSTVLHGILVHDFEREFACIRLTAGSQVTNGPIGSQRCSISTWRSACMEP